VVFQVLGLVERIHEALLLYMPSAAIWERSFRGGGGLGKKHLWLFLGQNQAYRCKYFAL